GNRGGRARRRFPALRRCSGICWIQRIAAQPLHFQAIRVSITIRVRYPGISSVLVFSEVVQSITIRVFRGIRGEIGMEPMLILPSIRNSVPISIRVVRIGVHPPPSGSISRLIGNPDPPTPGFIVVIMPSRLSLVHGNEVSRFIHLPPIIFHHPALSHRSEERRVGQEGRPLWHVYTLSEHVPAQSI